MGALSCQPAAPGPVALLAAGPGQQAQLSAAEDSEAMEIDIVGDESHNLPNGHGHGHGHPPAQQDTASSLQAAAAGGDIWEAAQHAPWPNGHGAGPQQLPIVPVLAPAQPVTQPAAMDSSAGLELEAPPAKRPRLIFGDAPDGGPCKSVGCASGGMLGCMPTAPQQAALPRDVLAEAMAKTGHSWQCVRPCWTLFTPDKLASITSTCQYPHCQMSWALSCFHLDSWVRCLRMRGLDETSRKLPDISCKA